MSVRFASKKKIVLRTICFKSDRTLVTRDVTYLHRSIRTNKVENGESWQLHWASHLFHVLASRAFHFVWNIRLIEWRLTYHARAKDRARKSREGAAKRRKNFTLFLYFFFSLSFFSSVLFKIHRNRSCQESNYGRAVARARRGTLSQHSGFPTSLISYEISIRSFVYLHLFYNNKISSISPTIRNELSNLTLRSLIIRSSWLA